MKKKTVALMMAAVMLAAILTGCGGGGGGGGQGSSGTPTISIFSHDLDKWDGADKDRVWEAIEKECGVNLEVGGVPINGYNEKINLMVNNFEAPDIFFYLPEDSTAYYKWATEDMMVNLDDYVKDDKKYPNLYKILHSEQYKNLTYDGKHTLIPRLAVNVNWGIYIRQDWLDNLHMKQPTTIDEFYDVLYAFTYKDPDGNGVNDTYGIGGSNEYYWFMPIYAAFQKKSDWNYNADKTSAEYMTFTDAFHDFLAYIRNCYEKGLIIKDFYTKTDDMKIEDFASGKVGMLIHNGEGHVQNIMQKISQASPHAKVDVINMIEGPAGRNIHGWGGWWGGYSVSADCKNIPAALKVLDYLMSEEGSRTRMYGLEGIHYTVQDGKIVITDENAANRTAEGADRFTIVKKDNVEYPYGSYAWGPWFGSLRTFEDDGTIRVTNDFTYDQWGDLGAKIQKYDDENVQVSDMVCVAMNNEEYADIMSQLDDFASTYILNAIVGEKNIDSDWDAYLAQANTIGYGKLQKMVYDTLKKLGR